METKQIECLIPDDILTGIADGTLKLYGPVVRNAKGEIVKHLAKVKTTSDIAQSIPKKNINDVIKIAKENHTVIGIGATIAIGSISLLYATHKIKSKLDHNASKHIETFEKTFNKYINAISNGKLNKKTINNLITAFNKIDELGISDQLYTNSPSEKFAQLDNIIYNYTIKLANINNIKLNGFSQPFSNINDNLRYYLAVQKKIFEINKTKD